jgi:hypothetical protein
VFVRQRVLFLKSLFGLLQEGIEGFHLAHWKRGKK